MNSLFLVFPAESASKVRKTRNLMVTSAWNGLSFFILLGKKYHVIEKLCYLIIMKCFFNFIVLISNFPDYRCSYNRHNRINLYGKLTAAQLQ